mmetsp:Transcript_25229/g.55128  ORF Transcript_25229/g.55128 Transcript_25229/m.55128 type:complete len:289 (-) Transcript_25229:1-867(-)
MRLVRNGRRGRHLFHPRRRRRHQGGRHLSTGGGADPAPRHRHPDRRHARRCAPFHRPRARAEEPRPPGSHRDARGAPQARPLQGRRVLPGRGRPEAAVQVDGRVWRHHQGRAPPRQPEEALDAQGHYRVVVAGGDRARPGRLAERALHRRGDHREPSDVWAYSHRRGAGGAAPHDVPAAVDAHALVPPPDGRARLPRQAERAERPLVPRDRRGHVARQRLPDQLVAAERSQAEARARARRRLAPHHAAGALFVHVVSGVCPKTKRLASIRRRRRRLRVQAVWARLQLR